MPDLEIRPLRPGESDAFSEIRREYLTAHPLAFESSADADEATPDAVARILASAPESVVIGAFNPDLVGVVGVYRSPAPKTRHKAHLWGMYVRPAARGRGIGRRLLQTAVAHARDLGATSLRLSVTSASERAIQLYADLGFETWGVEPDALRAGGRSVEERWMVLALSTWR